MRNKIIVEVKELPRRARMLDTKELQNVFGGCKGIGAVCSKDKDCCGHTSTTACYDRDKRYWKPSCIVIGPSLPFKITDKGVFWTVDDPVR